MNKWFTGLAILEIVLASLVTVSWLFSGTVTFWGVLVYIMASLVLGAYCGTAFERDRNRR